MGLWLLLLIRPLRISPPVWLILFVGLFNLLPIVVACSVEPTDLIVSALVCSGSKHREIENPILMISNLRLLAGFRWLTRYIANFWRSSRTSLMRSNCWG